LEINFLKSIWVILFLSFSSVLLLISESVLSANLLKSNFFFLFCSFTLLAFSFSLLSSLYSGGKSFLKSIWVILLLLESSGIFPDLSAWETVASFSGVLLMDLFLFFKTCLPLLFIKYSCALW